MLQRMVRLLLVMALASSGASARFLHVHAHGPDHGVSSAHGDSTDEHCAHHHSEGAHWHLAEGRASEADGSQTEAASRHHHAAVTLASVAVETSPVCVDVPAARVAMPDADAVPGPRGVRPPVDPTAGPDPPPRSAAAARAPPVRL